jgi:hypothetical protein
VLREKWRKKDGDWERQIVGVGGQVLVRGECLAIYIRENLSARRAKRFFEYELQPEKVSRAFRLCGSSGPGAIP